MISHFELFEFFRRSGIRNFTILGNFNLAKLRGDRVI